MIFCKACGKEIHESAIACPNCGAKQTPTIFQQEGSAWMSIASMVLGIMCVLAFFDDSGWDKDTVLGLGLFSVLGFIFGVISLSKKKKGKGMAIAGVAMSSIGFILLIGLS